MHNEHKRQSPYRSFWVVFSLMILIPIGFFLLVNALMMEYSPYSDELDYATARALGFGLGFLFHMICLLSGVFTPGWEAVKFRLREFFENLIVGVGYAFTTYLEDMRNDGITFILYMSVVAANFVLTADGFRDAIEILL